MRKTSLVLCLFLTIGTVNAQLSKTYSTAAYSIRYPRTWRLDTSRQMTTAVIFFSPMEGSDDTFDENVNVMTQDIRGQNIDLKKYKEISEGQVPRMGENAKVLKSEIQKTATGQRYYFECRFSMSGRKLQSKAYCRIRGGTAYLITLTAEETKFPRYDTLGTPILESFRLK